MSVHDQPEHLDIWGADPIPDLRKPVEPGIWFGGGALVMGPFGVVLVSEPGWDAAGYGAGMAVMDRASSMVGVSM